MNTIVNVTKSFLVNILGIFVIVFLLISFESYLNWAGFIRAEHPYRQFIQEVNEKIEAVSAERKRAENRIAEIDNEIAKQKDSISEWKEKIDEKGFWKTTKNLRFIPPLLKASLFNVPSLYMEKFDVFAHLEIKLKPQEKSFLTDRNKVLNPSFGDYWKQNFRHHALWYTGISAFLVFLSPLFWSLFFYYGVGLLVEKTTPIHPPASHHNSPRVRLMKSDAIIKVMVHAGEKIYLRGGWCKDRTGVKTKTKILWRWKYPLVSLAAELCELVVFSPIDKQNGMISVTAPYEDMFIGQLDLNGGELVIRPKYLIGVSETVQIKTKWNFSWHNILSGRIRQVILFGTGQIFIAGSWGVEQNAEVIEQDHRIEREMLLGYDYFSHYSLCRTETFWHYFRGKTSLFDIKIQHGTFLTQNNAWSLTRPVKGPLEKLLNVLLNGIGSLLGF